MRIPLPSRTRLSMGAAILIFYAIAVLVVTLWPTPVDAGIAPWIDRVLSALHRDGLPGWIGYHTVEFAANIAMFAPVGFLVAMLLPNHLWWLACVGCFTVSATIELAQAMFLSARFATAEDVVANSLGATVGALLCVALRGARAGRRLTRRAP